MSAPVVINVPHPHVRVDSRKCDGDPFVAGSRVRVKALYDKFKSGKSIASIVDSYPQLGKAKVFDALSFALDNPEIMKS